MSSDLKAILLKQTEDDFHRECKQIVENLGRLKSRLIEIANLGRWTLPIFVMGSETHYPQYEKDLDLLESCGLIKSKVRYTRHNAYREYTVTNEGAALADRLRTCTRATKNR